MVGEPQNCGFSAVGNRPFMLCFMFFFVWLVTHRCPECAGSYSQMRGSHAVAATGRQLVQRRSVKSISRISYGETVTIRAAHRLLLIFNDYERPSRVAILQFPQVKVFMLKCGLQTVAPAQQTVGRGRERKRFCGMCGFHAMHKLMYDAQVR